MLLSDSDKLTACTREKRQSASAPFHSFDCAVSKVKKSPPSSCRSINLFSTKPTGIG